MTEPRVNRHRTAPHAYVALLGVETYLKASPLEPAPVELVKPRASQINGCLFCLDMHGHDARKGGETEQRLYVLNAWRESRLNSDRERAALAVLAGMIDLWNRVAIGTAMQPPVRP